MVWRLPGKRGEYIIITRQHACCCLSRFGICVHWYAGSTHRRSCTKLLHADMHAGVLSAAANVLLEPQTAPRADRGFKGELRMEQTDDIPSYSLFWRVNRTNEEHHNNLFKPCVNTSAVIWQKKSSLSLQQRLNPYTEDHYGWETSVRVRTWHQNTITNKGQQLILPNQVALQGFVSVPEHSCNKSQ